MASHNSDQIAKLSATPRSLVKANEAHGRVRIAWWSFTTPAGGVAVSDTVSLVNIPQGARVVGGRIAWEALSSGGGTATVSLGVAGSAAKYLGATDADAAGGAEFGHTVALNHGDALTEDTILVATAGGEAWAASKVVKGYVLYVVD